MICKAIIKEKLNGFTAISIFNWSSFIKQALTKCKYIPIP
jgi:hypothetical protein